MVILNGEKKNKEKRNHGIALTAVWKEQKSSHRRRNGFRFKSTAQGEMRSRLSAQDSKRPKISRKNSGGRLKKREKRILQITNRTCHLPRCDGIRMMRRLRLAVNEGKIN